MFDYNAWHATAAKRQARLSFASERAYPLYPLGRHAERTSANIGACKALREARMRRNLHPLTGTRHGA